MQGNRSRYPAMRYRAVLAWTLWALGAGLAALALLVGALNGLDLGRALADFLVSTTVAALAYATVGALVAAQRPENRVGWLFCAAGVGAGITGFVAQYARYALLTRPGAVPVASVAAWLNLWIWLPGMVAPATFLLLLYPDGHLPSSRWRPFGHEDGDHLPQACLLR